MIRYTVGWLLLFEAAFLSIPMFFGVFYGESAATAFLISLLICVAVGALSVIKKPKNTAFYAREGFIIVSLSWITLSLFGALPFVLSGVTESFVDALFESASGFTTTGASIFREVEWLPKSIIVWRSFTHWIGGMGVLVFIMAFLPLAGGQNMHIMRAESTGPDVSKLVPKVKNTAIILYGIYLALTVIQFVTLLISGMSAFDSINTALSTAGTGGFGFKNDSFASATPAQQIIVTVFMLIFSVNFNSYYLVLKCKLRDAFNTEVRFFFTVVIAVSAIITFNLFTSMEHITGIGDAIRKAAFTVASLISTTGFTVDNFNLWPSLSQTLLILIMFIGGCAGSTAGGIKCSRVVILIKGMLRELRRIIHPRQVKKITLDSKPVDHEVVRSVNAYIVTLLVLFVGSLVIVSFDNYDLTTSFTSVVATINNVGPGLGAAYSNFADFSVLSKLVFVFDMLAGRLELFPMLILFSPFTYRKS